MYELLCAKQSLAYLAGESPAVEGESIPLRIDTTLPFLTLAGAVSKIWRASSQKNFASGPVEVRRFS